MVLTLNVCINCGKCMCDDSHASAFNFFNGERNTVSFVILHEMYIYVVTTQLNYGMRCRGRVIGVCVCVHVCVTQK